MNTTTGAATAVGSGLGTTDPLALVSVGSTLYGIDTFMPSNPSIYTIDTTTGVATEIGTVSGLPTGYTLDTMAGRTGACHDNPPRHRHTCPPGFLSAHP